MAKLHITAGYIIVGLIFFRLVWGFIGSPYAKFSQFVKSPKQIINYLKDMIKGKEKRYLGHNPAGAAMIITLLFGLSLLCLSGWLYTTDMFWGSDWVEEVHELLANVLIACVVLHIGGVIIASKRHKENLVKAMFTGRKKTSDHE